MSASVEVDVDLETLFTHDVPCSGNWHTTDPRVHGDPEAPAEYLIKRGCPKCNDYRYTPVCKFFAFGFARNKHQKVYCGRCLYRGPAPEFFLDLKAL